MTEGRLAKNRTLLKRRQLITTAAAALLAAAPVQMRAQQSSDNEGKDGDRRITGSWFGLVTATNPPIGQFNALTTFHDDGTLIDSRRYLAKPTPFGDLLETTGHGSWRRTGRDTFDVFMLLFVESVDSGIVVGVDNVRLSLSLSHNGRSLSGTFITELEDPSGQLLFQFSGEYVAKRIEA